MEWDSTAIDNLTLDAKAVGCDLGVSICRKLDLGASITRDVDMLYLIHNIILALEHSYYGGTPTLLLEDEDYDLFQEYISRIREQRNRFRGL